jgi:amino-acid N-acetyltransferase
MTAAVRLATPADREAMVELVASAGLPTTGLELAWCAWVAEDDGRIVGTAALERHGDALLLRSVAVSAAVRGSGVGGQLVFAVLAAAQPIGPVALLTETASDYFPRFGFTSVARADLHPDLAGSPELQGLCPDSVHAMVRR